MSTRTGSSDDKKTYVYEKSAPLEGISQTIFTITNRVILPSWLLLAFAPNWELTESIIHTAVLINCVAYTFALVSSWGWNPADTGFTTFRQVINLFRTSHERTLLGAWIHYLAFDILVAQQCVKDAKQISLPHWYVVPVLFLILMLGPMGFLLYIIERHIFLWTR